MDCIFCKIISGEIATKRLYETEHVIVIDDLHPRAPHHKLILPRKHIATLNDLTPEDTLLMGELAQAARHVAKQLGIDDSGYRVVMNCNSGAGQTVFHIHLHLLGGRIMLWPPG